ncbi:MAG: glycosyltransferase family 2 protein [Sediminibacterium sp.]|nr:glycosyltransferase family 2 protein [Sediminibacterium sp.]TXT32954.1 MAG: glycosyl transferase family protein [Chitinophagaceae bacterium]
MKISIITVVFNNFSQIKKTIDSVINQTYNNIEYIVIDGGSTDGSKELIEQYDSHIDCFISEKDNGIYHAMNKGWMNATGEYCLFLNSGDYLYNHDVIAEVVIKMEKSNFDIYFGNLFAFDEKQSWISKFEEPISLYYFQHSFIPHPATFTKRVLLEKLGGFYEHYRIISDWAFFVNCFLSKASFKQIDVTVTSFYMKGSSSSSIISLKDRNELFSNEFKFLEEDFKNFDRLRHFDTSRITKTARKISNWKIRNFK